MKCSSVALGLAAAQLVAGLGLAVLPIHTMLKLPSLATRDCPLWAAGPLLCAGIIGTIAVYSNTNYKSQNNRKPIFVLKVHSTVKGLFYTTAAVSVLGGVCSLWYLTLLWSSRYVYFNAGLRRTLGDPGDLVGEQYSAADRNDAAPDQLTAS